ncbi:hypothetical protein FACS189437_02050 [Bacteroidia bacterium]|nr:hypothetical protein FACS189437_02050 [Bacteroidia bacterium]
MKMKKMMFLMLTLFFLGSASMNAQVKIGGDGATGPVTGAVLELDGAKGALLLPKADTLAVTTPVAGMQVYRPGDNKVYVYDGTSWKGTAVGSAAPIITTQPKAFSWSRLRDPDGDPQGPAAAAATTNIGKLKVEATGDGLKYQWYQKTANKNAPDTKLTSADATTKEYAITVADVNVANWGMKSYYVVVSDANGNSVTSNVADVAIGCGAKTSTGGWLKFQCYNLGADTSKDPFVYASTNDSTSKDSKGWLFQWGRTADGHQWRSSATVAGPDTTTTYTGAASAKRAGQFITNNNGYTAWDWHWPQYDFFWRNWNDGRFPCAAGWRVPASDEWGSLFVDGGTYGSPGIATANTWTWTTSGYQIKPDGTTTSLFLPAAGYRNCSIGAFSSVGSRGAYWSSTTASSGAFYLHFVSSRVSPEISYHRAYGFAVRCVAE